MVSATCVPHDPHLRAREVPTSRANLLAAYFVAYQDLAYISTVSSFVTRTVACLVFVNDSIVNWRFVNDKIATFSKPSSDFFGRGLRKFFFRIFRSRLSIRTSCANACGRAAKSRRSCKQCGRAIGTFISPAADRLTPLKLEFACPECIRKKRGHYARVRNELG